MTPGLWAAALAGLAGSSVAGPRWLRVAQREHYLAPAGCRFGWRWWAGVSANRALWVVGALALLGSIALPPVEVVTAAVVTAGPLGLSLRGRTAKLNWTGRLRRLAAAWAALQLAALAGAAVFGVEVAAGGGAALVGVAVLAVPALVDAACAITAPLERRLVAPFVRRAAERLAAVGPTVVAITGSYGKTSTKGYVAHLLGTSRTVLASPKSYNNRAGLSRAVNEHLAPGTEVFVAEMGTYGKGEIAEMCAWTRPTVAVITAIGPVHLERFGTEEAIVEAKSEILEGASAAVLNVDDPRLAAVADRLAAEGRRVWRCSGVDPRADVYVGPPSAVHGAKAPLPPRPPCPGPGGAMAPPPSVVTAREEEIGAFGGVPGAGGAAATNVACAVAVALELGAPAPEVGRLLATLPATPNRLARLEGAAGFTILDDTYNSNPAGARLALGALGSLGASDGAGNGHRRVLVTPGMVELGRRQPEENRALAAMACPVVTELVVVGHTNRRALLAGAGDAAGDSSPEVVLVANRDQAVAWVRDHLGPGDAVLYENDLPDHFP